MKKRGFRWSRDDIKEKEKQRKTTHVNAALPPWLRYRGTLYFQ